MTHNILAIDIGGSKILTALVRMEEGQKKRSGHLSGCRKAVLHAKDQPGDILRIIRDLIPQSLEDCHTDWSDVEAIGVTIPGIARPESAYWVYAPFSGIRDFPIGDELKKSYDRPVYADNDVNACAWAEKVFGVCQDTNDFLWVTISNGIGGGLVLNGRIYPGSFSGAAEIGHFNIVENGAPCGCGNHGCLEAEAAGPAIARRYKEAIATLPESQRPKPLEEINAATIAQAAREGNETAREVFRKTGYYLGRASAMAANLINPGKIVFGGGVAAAFDLFGPELKKTFWEQVFRNVNEKVSLEPTGLGYEAGLFGAASLTRPEL